MKPFDAFRRACRSNTDPHRPHIASSWSAWAGPVSNAIDRLKMDNSTACNSRSSNTDFQALSTSPVAGEGAHRLGRPRRGLGRRRRSRTRAVRRRKTDREKIAAIVKDQDLVFLVLPAWVAAPASGAAPVVAENRGPSRGALVIAFVTMPFSFEGGPPAQAGGDGLQGDAAACAMPSSRCPMTCFMQEGADNENPWLDSFARADEWIGRGVK